MAIRHISYTLRKPGQNYKDLLDYIRSFDHAQITESSYAVDTQLGTRVIFNECRRRMDQNDHVYVTTMTPPYTGHGPLTTNDWLKKKLGAGE